MARLLFVTENFTTQHARGGEDVLARCHLDLLVRSGHTICAANLRRIEQQAPHNPTWSSTGDQIQAEHAGSGVAQQYSVNLKLGRDSRWRRLLGSMVRPDLYRLGSWISEHNLSAFHQVLVETRPDLIWAEDLYPASLAANVASETPVVYSHYDWKWRIKWHRVGREGRSPRKLFQLWMSRRHEESIVRRVAGCVSASTSETNQMRQLGANVAEYFPTLYQPTDDPPALPQPNSPVRIVHLGSMDGTANRIGLLRFLEVVWPRLNAPPGRKLELHVVGSLNRAPSELLSALDRVGAICTGFVEDLRDALRPFDIHVIPWEHDTGTRTRIPLALNFAQAIVSTEAAAACLPELRTGINCVLVRDLDDMAGAIESLAQDEKARAEMSLAGRQTFLQRFTLEAQQPRFDAFLDLVLRTSHRSA